MIRIPEHSARRLLHKIDVDEPLENPPLLRVQANLIGKTLAWNLK